MFLLRLSAIQEKFDSLPTLCWNQKQESVWNNTSNQCEIKDKIVGERASAGHKQIGYIVFVMKSLPTQLWL